MKRFGRIICTIIAEVWLAQSCVISDVVKDINSVTGTQDGIISADISAAQPGYLIVEVDNCQENLYLSVDSLQINNVLILDTSFTSGIMTVYRGNFTTAHSTTIPIPSQSFSPWIPIDAPEERLGSYIKIFGQLYNILPGGEPFILCNSPIYTPIYGTIYPASTTTFTISITPESPLYILSNESLQKALTPITFSPIIEGWE